MSNIKIHNSMADLMSDYLAPKKEIKDPVYLGSTEKGDEIVLSLKRMRHVLVSGASQSGKSYKVRQLLPDIVKHADTAIWSTKDSDFIDFLDKASLITSDVNGFSKLIRRIVGEIERRNVKLKKRRMKEGVEAQCDDKPFVLMIDEFQSFADQIDTKTDLALKQVIREGAGLNIWLWLITQTPSKKVLGDSLRDNIATDIAFRQRDMYTSRMAVGSRRAEFLQERYCIVRNGLDEWELIP